MRLAHPSCAAVVLLAAGSLCGCGGSGGGGAAILTHELSVNEDAYADSTGGYFEDSSNGISVGDTSADAVRRGLVRFRVSGSLPFGATVVSAELRLYQANVAGAPYLSLGAVVVDHIDTGADMDAADYAGGTLTSQIGLLSLDPTLGPKSLDVTAAVLADRAAERGESEFRLRFPGGTDFDNTLDAVYFEDKQNHHGTGQGPLLILRYLP